MVFKNPVSVILHYSLDLCPGLCKLGITKKWSQMCRAVRWGKVTFTLSSRPIIEPVFKNVNGGTFSSPPSFCIECFGLLYGCHL